MALARFLRYVLVFLAAVSVISVESAPPPQSGDLVYTRYVRRKPTRYSRMKYVKEVVEVFHTKRRPPPFAFLFDEDLTRFVRCDYDPSLSGCDVNDVTTTMKSISSNSTTSNGGISQPTPTAISPDPESTTTSTEDPDIDEDETENDDKEDMASGEEYQEENSEPSETQDDNYPTDDNEVYSGEEGTENGVES